MRSLELVDLIDTKNQPLDGLVAVREHTSVDDPHERAILLQAETFRHIDFVFFRRFNGAQGEDARSSQVAAYVVDNSRQNLTEDDLAGLHHKLWLHGVAPLIYVAWPTRVDILSCARKPDFWDASDNEARVRYQPAETIHAANESPQQTLVTAADISDALAKRFSGYRLAEGTFWDDPENQKLAKDDAAAHRSLIQAIVEADKELDGANKPLRRRLLVLTVLIKYLEDRGVFPPGHFGRFHAGARSFRDMLRMGTVEEVSKLLRYFERKFNGDVFSLGDDGQQLTQAELRHFTELVEAKTLGGQQHFWELFSFQHIPVEVISRLYQRFVTGHGAVYTPPFLAALLLDQVMPYDRLTGKEKVLDPACGSGIFLVGAFKRLVIHWRSRNCWQKPTVDDLKEILARSIHGVELETGAVDLTAFSLALAVCDALEPPVIWRSLKLDKLRGRNLREGDFFDTATLADSANHAWPKTFDIVVGNPPFESKLTPAAKAVDKARPKSQPRLPDKQVAYLFLEQGLRSLSPGGSLCLIQPHGLLYNSKTGAFRQHLMSLARLDSAFDFVSMRGMYEGADPKTIAWHAVQEPLANGPVNHLTFRRTYSASERIAFEIDHYDWHVISQRQTLENPFVWRIGLLGGGRLQEISERIRRFRTLADFVGDKNWEYGEGFIVGNRAIEAKFLTDSPLLPTPAFTEDSIDENLIERVTETHFEAPRNPDRFAPPLVLIKEHASLPIAFWDHSSLAYRDKIVGIHAPPEQRTELVAVFTLLQARKRFYQFCCTINGTQALIGKATSILKQDIDRLPFPDDPSELDLAFWEDALKEDVLNHMTDFVRLGQDSDLLKKAATKDDVREYSSLYVQMLGSLYRNLQAADAVPLNGLIAQPFYFGDRPDVSWLGQDCEDALHRLVYDQSRESLRTVRVVRYYESNVILIVKPNRLRYWIRSTAIRDADDTLIDLREQGW
ncbi:MAG: N-6 DNA methylase [Planctomycetota bacterium]|nr:N-6 DNA methylase [Planctomycetota bacterium]